MTDVAPEKDVQFFAELLLEIESRVDVNAIQIDGVHLWPLMRLQLGRKFKASDPLADAGLAGGDAPPSAPSAAPDGYPTNAEERRALIRARRAQVAPTREAAQRFLERQWERVRQVGNVDFVVLSKIEKYYQRIGERRYAPILDPVLEDLRERGGALPVALEPLGFACVNEPLRVDIEPQMLATKHWPATADPEAEAGLERINAVVRSINPDFVVPPKQIFRRFDRFRKRMPFFRQLLEILQPRALFMSSYTGWQPAIWAARQLGIPVVDIQHGGQQSTHYPTTHYGTLPPDGYALLPDYFWVWGEGNRRYIAKWLPGAARRHVPLVGGNRNVAKWYRDRDAGRLSDADQAFLQHFAERSGLVLVTLSYAVDKLVPDQLMEAIAQSPDLTWLIRLHPIHRSTETRDQIVNALRERGCRNFFVDDPTSVRLHTTLAVCQHHLTPFSTSGREATAFGVPTTICHPIGALAFPDEIAEGAYGYADRAEDIVERIRRSLAQGETDSQHRRDAVEISDQAVDALLARVLGGTPTG